ncbi:unnamed protein product [Danaus chrysippus]|uniref:(African queen) hypothetical protein n=1 Tax=Danaus chrysippus TaxID=151541 RepID=A0A8J2QEI0_9NEOP|nr:unnamed protein product [Danaus chrysippus]
MTGLLSDDRKRSYVPRGECYESERESVGRNGLLLTVDDYCRAASELDIESVTSFDTLHRGDGRKNYWDGVGTRPSIELSLRCEGILVSRDGNFEHSKKYESDR